MPLASYIERLSTPRLDPTMDQAVIPIFDHGLEIGYRVGESSHVTIMIHLSQMNPGNSVKVETFGRGICDGILLFTYGKDTKTNEPTAVLTAIHDLPNDQSRRNTNICIRAEEPYHDRVTGGGRRAWNAVTMMRGNEEYTTSYAEQLTCLQEFVGPDGTVTTFATEEHQIHPSKDISLRVQDNTVFIRLPMINQIDPIDVVRL